DRLGKCIVDGKNCGLFAPMPQPSMNPHWKELDAEDTWNKWNSLCSYSLTPTDRRESTPTDKGEYKNVLLTEICRFLHKMKLERTTLLIQSPVPQEKINNEIVLACRRLKSYRIGLIEEPVAWLSVWVLAEKLADQLPQNFGLGLYLCEVFQSKPERENQQRQS